MIGLTQGDPAGVGPELARKVARRVGPGTKLRLLGTRKIFRCGHPTRAGAQEALLALEESVRLLQKCQIQAVVNGPVAKEWLARAGFRFPGQTEFYARRFGCRRDGVTMCMVGPRLRIALATTHVSLRRAVAGLTTQAILRAGLHLA